MLCEASTLDTGAMWECPLLIELNYVPESTGKATKRTLGQSLNNISVFREHGDGDGGMSPAAAIANDPISAAAQVR